MSPLRVFTILATGIALMLAAGVSVAQNVDPLRASYERAQAFQLAGELDRAEAEYRTGVLPRALRRLGNLNSVEGRTGDAIELLESAAALDPADFEIQTDLAVALLRRRDLARAGRIAAAVVAASRNARARSLLGRIHLLQGDATAAARELRQALSEEARFDTAHALALASLRLGRVETARALFDQLLSAGPNPDVLVLVGRAYLEAGHPREAAAQFSRALEQRPETRLAHYYLGLARLAGDDPERIARAREDFEAELRLDGTYAPARQALDLLARERAGELSGKIDSVIFAMLPTASSADAPQRAALRAQLTDILGKAWHNLAVIHTRRGESEAAAHATREAERWTTDTGLPTSTASEDAKAALVKADTLLRKGHVEEAECATWDALSLVPDRPGAIRLLGLIRAAQKRYDEAEALLRRAIALDAAQQDAWISLAEVYAASGEPRRALDALDRFPTDQQNQTAMIRVRAYLALGLLDDARRLLPIAAEQAGAEAAADIVTRLVERGLTREAERFLAGVQPRVLLDPKVLVASARLRMQQRDTARAEADLERALAADERSVGALRMLASLASERGDHNTATDLLRRAREAAPDAPEVLEELARAAARAARLEEALDAARRLAALRPADVAVRYLLGVTLLQNQEWSDAIAAFGSPPPAAASDPRWPLGLGMAQFGRRDYGAAKAAFERALLLDSGQVEAHYNLGLIAREQGRTADAIARMEDAVKLSPSHVPALTELGGLYLLREDYPRAQAALERAATLDEDAPAPHYQLALLYTRLGDEERARRAMEKFQKAREKMLIAREQL